MKVVIRLLMLILLVKVASSCYDAKDTYKGSEHDPNKPIVIKGFAPDSGGIRTSIVIEGENLGLDTSQIKFYFGKKRANLIGLNGEAALVQMPKQPGDTSFLSIVIGGDSMVYDKQTFKYRIQASISTVCGKAFESGSKDGSLQEATFLQAYYIDIDADDNICVMDYDRNRARLVSLKGNKVVTLASANFRAPLAADNGRFYLTTWVGGRTIMFDPETGWLPEEIGSLVSGVYYENICEIPQLSDHFICLTWDGDLFKFSKNAVDESTIEDLNNSLPIGNQTTLKYNTTNKYLYAAQLDACKLYRAKVNGNGTIEPWEFYSGTSPGFANGSVKIAKFGRMFGMDICPEGNVYIPDYTNNCIRKISLDGIVTTFAGTPGTSGYKDGHPTKEALMGGPTGIAISKDGMIYFTDYDYPCIRKIAIE